MKKPKRSVSFSRAVHVMLIPTREEYCQANLDTSMWWDRDDYDTFKDDAVSELKSLMRVDPRIDCKVAQTLLYQPLDDNIAQIKLKLKIDPKMPEIKEIRDLLPTEENESSSESKNNLESHVQMHTAAPSLFRVQSQLDLVHDHMKINSSTANESIHHDRHKNKEQDKEKLSEKNSHKNKSTPKQALHPLALMCS